MRYAGALVLASIAVWGSSGATALAGDFSLEAGVIPTFYYPEGGLTDENFNGFGVSGTASYEIERWGFGARVLGTISNHTDLHLTAGSVDLKGVLMRRQYGLEIFSRLFFLDRDGHKRWYLELGFLGQQTDFVHTGDVYVLPQSPDYTRIFLLGGGFSIGAGYRPINGPFFFQLNYMLTHFEKIQIVGEMNNLHQILDEQPLSSNYFVHAVILTVGLDVFGRP